MNHTRFHEGTAKKIHFTKIDPSMTFGFYLQDHKDYIKFEKFMEQSKRNFGEQWIFSHMDTKPSYLKQEVFKKAERGDDLVKKTPTIVGSVDDFDILTANPGQDGSPEEEQKQQR